MKKTKLQAGRRASSLAALSGAGAALLAGGVAEGAIMGGHLGIRVAATKTAGATGPVAAHAVGLLLQQNMAVRVVDPANPVSVNNAPQAGDVVYGGKGVGVALVVRDPETSFPAGQVRFTWGAAWPTMNGSAMNPNGVVYSFSNIPFGSLIGPSAASWAGLGTVEKGVNPDVGNPNWNGSQNSGDGYLGFRVKTADGVWHYGWLLITDIGATADGGYGFTIDSYGINQKANRAIAAGNYDGTEAGIGTPEPAASGLALLALGAAGVLRSRRKREDVA